MKPFNLEQALAGAPVVNSNGEKIIRVIHVPEAEAGFKVIAVKADGSVTATHEDGKIYKNSSNGNDLFMVTTKKEGWVVMFHNNSQKDFIVGTKIWASREDAEIWSKGCEAVFAIAKIEWEE